MLLAFAADRVAKAFVFRRGARARGPIRPARNERPALWPSGSPARWFASLALAFAAAAALVALQSDANPWLAIGLGCALGGALGNVYDRARHGAVLDFLHLGIGGRFNVADVALVLGLTTAVASQLACATALLSSGGS